MELEQVLGIGDVRARVSALLDVLRQGREQLRMRQIAPEDELLGVREVARVREGVPSSVPVAREHAETMPRQRHTGDANADHEENHRSAKSRTFREVRDCGTEQKRRQVERPCKRERGPGYAGSD